MCVFVQPLYAPHTRVAKGVYKNIIIVATEFNSVYGFDAGAHFSSSSYFLASCNGLLVKSVIRLEHACTSINDEPCFEKIPSDLTADPEGWLTSLCLNCLTGLRCS